MFCVLECGLLWWMFHVSLRRMCVLLCLDEVLNGFQLNPLIWWCCLIWLFLIFCLLGLLIMDGCGCWSDWLWWWIHLPRSSMRFFLIYFCSSVAMHIHTKSCNILLENWPLYHNVIPLFISVKSPSSALSKISTVMPVCFCLVLAWYIFLHPLLLMSLYLNCDSCRQHVIKSYFIIYWESCLSFVYLDYRLWKWLLI